MIGLEGAACHPSLAQVEQVAANLVLAYSCLSRLLRNTRACARGHPRSAMPDRRLVMPSSWAYVPPRSVAGRIAQIACGKATK
jgi:hypothetical protein